MGGHKCCCQGCIEIDRSELPSSVTIGAQTRYRADWTSYPGSSYPDRTCCWYLDFFSIGSTYLNARQVVGESAWFFCPLCVGCPDRWIGICSTYTPTDIRLVVNKPPQTTGFCLRLIIAFSHNVYTVYTDDTSITPCNTLFGSSTSFRDGIIREIDTTWPNPLSSIYTLDNTDHIDMPDYQCGPNEFFEREFTDDVPCPGVGVLGNVVLSFVTETFEIQVDN